LQRRIKLFISHLNNIPYLRNWIQAIDVEQRANLKQAWMEAIPIDIGNFTFDLRNQNYLLRIKFKCNKIPNWIKKDKLVSIGKENNKNKVIEGQVFKINFSQKTSILIVKEQIEEFIQNKYNSFWLLPYSKIPYKLMQEGLEKVALNSNSILAKNMLKNNNIIDSNLKVTQGPPGTGKTTTIGRFCKEFYQKNEDEYIQKLKKKQTDFIPKILLTAYTHKACANIAEKLDEESVPFIAIDINGMSAHLREKYDLKCLADRAIELSKSNRYQIDLSKYRKNIQKQLVEQSMFIISTAMSVPKRFGVNYRPYFKYAIADEGSQMPLPILAGIASLAEQTYVYGDPIQLPPVILAPLLETQEKENPLGKTIFDNTPKMKISLLDKQYRGRPEIFMLVSGLFYEGKIKTGRYIPLLDRRPAIEFIDTSKINPQEHNRVNYTEAQICKEIVANLAKERGLKQTKIGIISPFRAQASYLQHVIKAPSTNVKLDIGTVHTVQGRTYDCVILSLSANTLSPFLNPTESWLEKIKRDLFSIFIRLEEEAINIRNLNYPSYNEKIAKVFKLWKEELSNYEKTFEMEKNSNTVQVRLFKDLELDFTFNLKDMEKMPQNEFAANIFNVALSRAKSQLTIIGNYNVLQRNPIVNLIYRWISQFGNIETL